MDNSAFLTGYEFLIVTPYLILVLFCLRLVKQRHSDESLNRYFYPGFFFKLSLIAYCLDFLNVQKSFDLVFVVDD